jgi:hypothetical protein
VVIKRKFWLFLDTTLPPGHALPRASLHREIIALRHKSRS